MSSAPRRRIPEILLFIFFFSTPVQAELCANRMAKWAIEERLESTSAEVISEPLSLELNIVKPSAALLDRLRADEIREIPYIVTQDDRLFLIDGPIQFESGRLLFTAMPGNAPNAPAEVVAIKEGGFLRYQVDPDGREKARFSWIKKKKKAKQSFVFDQTYGVELGDPELMASANQLDEALEVAGRADASIARQNGKITKARVIECADVLASQKRGDGYVISRLANDLTILSGAIALSAPDRFTDAANSKALAVDYANSSSNSLIRSTMGLLVTTGTLSTLKRYGVRIGGSAASTLVQASIFKLFTDHDPVAAGGFGFAYSLLMIPKSDFMDRLVLKKLPNLAYESCLKNSPLKIFVSPRAIRFVDGIASTILFLEGRKAVLGEGDRRKSIRRFQFRGR